MSLRSPLVSICLPVYNGDNYVSQAIRSIVGQSFEDFELIISDNASTDGTSIICLDAAAHDSRVRYHRADRNRGLAWNHNRAFELARSPYIAWIGHDDLMERDYIRQCVEGLTKDPGAVLSYTNSTYIDEEGKLIRLVSRPNSGASDRPSKRFYDILHDGMCDPIYGLMKRDILIQTHLHRGFADSDRVLLAEMGLRGRFHSVKGHLFSRRIHPEASSRKYKGLRERTITIFDPAKSGQIFSPVALETRALLSAIHQVRLPFKERVRCYRSLVAWLWTDHISTLPENLRERASRTLKSYLSAEQVLRLKAAKARLLKI